MRRRLSSLISSDPPVIPESPCQSILLNGHNQAGSSDTPQSTSSRARSASRSSIGSPSPSKPSCSSKVSFAPLPVVPPELKRRSTITLGVAARKNLLGEQGSVGSPSGPSTAGNKLNGDGAGVKSIYLTDEEWEVYKSEYAAKHGSEAVDVGVMVKSGAKSLWRKVRPSRSPTSPSSSTASTSVLVPYSPPSSVGSPRPQNRRRDSEPTLSPMHIDRSASVGLDKVDEETSALQPLPSPTSPGGTRRSSAPNYGDWATHSRSSSFSGTEQGDSERLGRSRDPASPNALHLQDRRGSPTPLSSNDPSHAHIHHHHHRIASPPPRLEDRLPDEDESEVEAQRMVGSPRDEGNTEEVPFDPADRIPWTTQSERSGSGKGLGKDAAILGFDRMRVGFSM